MSRIITGPRFVLEALRGRAEIEGIFVEQGRDFPKIREIADQRKIPLREIPKPELEDLSEGVRHQGVVALAGAYDYCELEDILETHTPDSTLVALDEISDPQNFGAIIRSAVALGADALIIPKRRSAALSHSVVRASAGATEHARIAKVTNLARSLDLLRKHGFWIVGLATEASRSLHEALANTPGPVVLVIGSEGRGLRELVRKKCDELVHIPQTQKLNSLNASVATAIALYERVRSQGMQDVKG